MGQLGGSVRPPDQERRNRNNAVQHAAAPANRSLDPRHPLGWPFPDRRPPWLLRLLIRHLWLLAFPVLMALFVGVVLLSNSLDLSSLTAPRPTQGIMAIAVLVAFGSIPYFLFRRPIDWTRHDLLLHREASAALRDVALWRRRNAPHAPDATRALVENAASQLRQALREGAPSRILASLHELDVAIGSPNPIGKRSIVREYLQTILIAIVIAQLFRASIVDVYKVPSTAMLPALQHGEHVLVAKALYGLRVPRTRHRLLRSVFVPRRGDIVLFTASSAYDHFAVGRVMAVAGDTIERCSGTLRINHEVLPRAALHGTCEYEDITDAEPLGALRTVPCSAYQEQLERHRFWTLHPSGAGAFTNECEPAQTVPPEHVFILGDNRVVPYSGGLVDWARIEGPAWMIFWSAGAKTSVRSDRMFRRVHAAPLSTP